MYISCSFLRWMPNSTGAQKEHRGYPLVTWQWKIFNLQMLFSIKSSIFGNVHVWLPEDRNWLFNHWRIATTLKQNISALDLRNRGVQILMAQFVGSYHPLSSPVREGSHWLTWNDRNADPLATGSPGLFAVLAVQLWVLTLREGGVQVEGSGTKRLFRIPLW